MLSPLFKLTGEFVQHPGRVPDCAACTRQFKQNKVGERQGCSTICPDSTGTHLL